MSKIINVKLTAAQILRLGSLLNFFKEQFVPDVAQEEKEFVDSTIFTLTDSLSSQANMMEIEEAMETNERGKWD